MLAILHVIFLGPSHQQKAAVVTTFVVKNVIKNQKTHEPKSDQEITVSTFDAKLRSIWITEMVWYRGASKKQDAEDLAIGKGFSEFSNASAVHAGIRLEDTEHFISRRELCWSIFENYL